MKSSRVAGNQAAPSVSLIIVTWRRPHDVRSCLASLSALRSGPEEILVIDAGSDDETRLVVSDFPGVVHVPFPGGAGHMTTSRNIGLLHASGDIIAFLDDDTIVHEGWLEGVVAAFSEQSVGAVAGRTCNGHAGEDVEGVDEIGQLLPDGRLTGFFAADPGHRVEVAHGIGANMAFRRHVLGELGGFRDDFHGSALREDADVFFRVAALGYRIVFSPDAAVDHLGAPHARGRRFDFRYMFWARHNHALLLGRNFGLGSTYFWSWLRGELARSCRTEHSGRLRRSARVALGLGGICAGVLSAARKGTWRSTDPHRSDEIGNQIRSRLTGLSPTKRMRSRL